MAGAALTYRIEADIAQVEQDLRRLPEVSATAISRALNRTGASVRTRARREITRISGLKAGFINSKITVHRATRYKLYADIEARTRGILLSQLPGARQTTKGISYRGGGKTISVAHAFIHHGKSYVRMTAESAGVDPQGKYGLVGRLPVRFVWAPNLVTIFGSARLYRYMEERAAEQWPKEIAHQVSYALGRLP